MQTGQQAGTDRMMAWLAAALLCGLAGHTPVQGSGTGREDLAAPSDTQLTRSLPPSSVNSDVSSALFVPVLLISSGLNNSFFTSELTLTNRGTRTATLRYTYTAHRGGRSGTASESLTPGRQKVVSNAIDHLRSLGIPIPNSGNRIGTLRVGVSGSSDVGVTVRTTTRVADGRAGLAYPGIAVAAGFQEAVYLCGLRQNAQDRSNVAFQNMGTAAQGDVTLRATVFSGDPENPGSQSVGHVTLKPGGFHQFNGILARAGFSNGYVRLERVGGTAPFYAYGVINDQANSDGSFIFPVTESSLAGTVGQTLPVIIEHPNFSSELIATNFSDSPKSVFFSFVANAIGREDRAARFSLNLAAGEQKIIPEIVEYLRRQGVDGVGPAGQTFAGSLSATALLGDLSGVVIGARTGSPGGGGQYSVFYSAVPYGAAISETAWIDALQQNQENRSNLAVVNTGEVDSGDSVFALDIHDGVTGRLVNTVTGIRVPEKGWYQVNGILDRYAPGTTQGYVRIRKTSGNNPFLAYGVINDGGAPGERSGDGAYLPAMVRTIDPGTEAMTDREVLEAFHYATGGANWRNRTNWLSETPLSEWYGVTTDENGRVTRLDLPENQLSGTIPPSLARLAQLRWLNLGDNRLSGNIPAELGGLTHLQWLYLWGNQLSGTIPVELGGLTLLQELGFGDNQLSGRIPTELGGLTHLKRLYLRGNRLSGAIPKNLMQLSELTLLDIRRTGVCVPADAAFKAWLATLSDFQSSGLTCDGSRRVSFSASSYLLREGRTVEVVVRLIDQTREPPRSTVIGLTATPGGGATAADYAGVPESVTITAPATEASFVFTAVEDDHFDPAETVVLGFQRPLPSGVTAGASDSVTVTIHDPGTEATMDREVLEVFYHATGGPNWRDSTRWLSAAPLSAWFGIETDGNGRVTRLNLPENKLSGTIPPVLARLAQLQWLNLDDNQLSGRIPAELGGLTRLQWLGLGGNQLSGTIPAELGGLTHLERLYLWDNQLRGPIPPELGELTVLQELSLRSNQLSGTIPAELGGLTRLQWLYLWDNQLSGSIPPELGELTVLQELNLGSNQLSGTIPAELGGLPHLHSLILRSNQLSGTIPAELANLTSLQRLLLWSNRLSGAIPAELANLAGLQQLNLGGNQLSGPIPPELANLTGLQLMNLEGNQLSGTMPPGLQLLPLKVLNLMANSVCVPADAGLEQWLATIDEYIPSGLSCGHSLSEMSTIDVALFYTPAARKLAGGAAAIEAATDLMIAETNQAYEASGVNQQIVLVAREEVQYVEENGSGGSALSRLADRSDGYMDEIHAIRDRAGADLVHLIADVTDVAGIANLSGAFSLICADGCNANTFAHELGHNMGLSHERYITRGSMLPYSYGYVNQQAFATDAPASAYWNTIMAYGTQCSDAGFSCGLILRFSNPKQRYLGDPLGVPGDERTHAVTGPSDAVRALNITRHSVSGIRPRAAGNRMTLSSRLSQVRPRLRTGGALAPVPSGDLFRTVAPTVEVAASGQLGAALDRATLRRREVTVDLGRLERVTDGEGTALRLNLFGDVVLTGIIEQRTPTYSGGYALLGRLVGVPEGTVTLVVNGSMVAGTVRLPGATYRIRPAGAGAHAIMQVDPSQLPQRCGTVTRTTGYER